MHASSLYDSIIRFISFLASLSEAFIAEDSAFSDVGPICNEVVTIHEKIYSVSDSTDAGPMYNEVVTIYEDMAVQVD